MVTADSWLGRRGCSHREGWLSVRFLPAAGGRVVLVLAAPLEGGELSIKRTILGSSLPLRLGALRKMDGDRVSAVLSPKQGGI